VQDGVLRKGTSSLFIHDLRKATSFTGDRIVSCYTRKKYEVMEVGLMHPEQVATKSLNPGQVGYIACNMKQSSEGELISDSQSSLNASYQPTSGTRFIDLGNP